MLSCLPLPFRSFVALSLAILAVGSISAQDAIEAKIQSLAEPYIDAKIVDGLSIGVIKGGKSASVHLGQANASGDKPNDNTIYEIGSVSKVFTGLMLADAISRGEARLEQPAQELLPAGATMPKGNRDITLEDLAVHVSGLPRLSDNMSNVQSDDPYARYTSKKAYDFLNNHKLQREPGAKHEYSNFGMSLLGHLVSRKTGSYDERLQERIVGPLNMTDTRVAMTDSMKSRLATPHTMQGTEGSQWSFADLPGAGGIHSSTRDMLRFASACLDPPDNETGKALDFAWQKRREAKAGEPAMGLAWHIAGDGSTRWHNGQTGGYHSMLMVNRQAKLAVVVLCNTASMEIDRLANNLVLMLVGAPVTPREFAKEAKVAPEVMQRYVGRYQLAPTFIFTVSVKNGRLMVGVTNQPTHQVYPKSDTEWFYKVVDAQLTFKLDARGKCTALELFQNGVRQTAKRIR